MQNSTFQTENMTQGHLKIHFCMQKLLKIGKLLFSINCLFQIIATNYIIVLQNWNIQKQSKRANDLFHKTLACKS